MLQKKVDIEPLKKTKAIDGVTMKYAINQDKEDLCQFEKQAHTTEPDIWLEVFNKDAYQEKMGSIDLEQLENNKIVIAIEDGAIVGRCDISVHLSTLDGEETGYIDWIYVLKDQRGRGIGKALFSRAEAYFSRKDVKSYYLFTAENPQAQAFYHGQDFEFSTREVAEKSLR